MPLRSHPLPGTALILALGTLMAGLQPMAQEQDPAAPPAQEPAVETPAKPEESPEAEKEKVILTDRLTLRAGFGGMSMRSSNRSDSRYKDGQTSDNITQVNEMNFDSSVGAVFVADVWYEIGKGWYIIGSLTTGGLGSADYTDSRQFSNLGGPGETEFVRFGAEHESDYLDWAIGGARRFFPTKRYKDSKLYLDAVLLFTTTEAEYSFDAGEVLKDPFHTPAFNPSFGYDPFGRDSATLNMDYHTLIAGIRFGGQVSERFSLEGHFLPVWFGSYEGEATIPFHGTPLVHGGIHKSVNDPTGAGFGEITDNDVFAPTLDLTQDSSSAKGLRVGISSYVTVNTWLTLDFGYQRNFIRSVGGEETRHYSDEALAGCPSQNCPVDRGDLLQGSLVGDSIFVMGRFRLQ